MKQKMLLDDVCHLLALGAAGLAVLVAGTVAALDDRAITRSRAVASVYTDDLAAGVLIYRLPPVTAAAGARS